MLRQAGYTPVLLASEGWNPPEASVFSDIETIRLPSVAVSNGAGVDATFEEDIDKLYGELDKILGDGDVVLTHDLIFLPDYVKHNLAARKLAKERPGIRWVHWIHSATSPHTLIREREMYGDKYKELLNEKFPNSIIAFPNAYDIPRVAKNFSFEEDEIVEVPHSTVPVEGMHPLVYRLYYEKKLWESDVLMVYPLRLDRGKNAEVNIRIMKGLKDAGVSSHLIFCDFQSTGGDKVTYREELKGLAGTLGVSDRVTFLSEFDESAKLEISHEIILQLFELSNVFCLPSKSETYSLVAQEAMLKGNLCILNHDFAPMRQIYGTNAIYRQFSANIAFDGYDGEINTEYGDINQYFKSIGINIKYWLSHDKVLAAKTWVRVKRNPEAVFKNYVEPLLVGSRNDDSETTEV
jgi:glycosyltransferase involved in cell wall biosynthesis